MKLIVLRDNLKNALDIVSRAVTTNLNLPVLGNILIKPEANQIKLSGTNLELAVTKTIPGKVIEEGGTTIPLNIFSNIINNIASERVNLQTKGSNLHLQTENYEALIQGIAESEFPIIPRVKKEKEFLEINSSLLKENLGKTIVAATISEIRPEISGVLMIIEPSTLKLVATDSFRLAETKIPNTQFKNTLEQGLKIIIPLKTAQELTRILRDGETVKLFIDNNQILFETLDTEIVSRLIEGAFPDYEPIVPKSFDTELFMEREELVNSLKLASAFSGKVSQVSLRAKEKRVLEVYSSDNAVGENNYLVAAKMNGAPIEVSFNWRFLLDGVKSGTSKEVFLGLNGDSRAALIKSPEDISYFYILMPIKGG